MFKATGHIPPQTLLQIQTKSFLLPLHKDQPLALRNLLHFDFKCVLVLLAEKEKNIAFKRAVAAIPTLMKGQIK